MISLLWRCILLECPCGENRLATSLAYILYDSGLWRNRLFDLCVGRLRSIQNCNKCLLWICLLCCAFTYCSSAVVALAGLQPIVRLKQIADSLPIRSYSSQYETSVLELLWRIFMTWDSLLYSFKFVLYHLIYVNYSIVKSRIWPA